MNHKFQESTPKSFSFSILTASQRTRHSRRPRRRRFHSAIPLATTIYSSLHIHKPIEDCFLLMDWSSRLEHHKNVD
ncbi:hypothetical protein K1719_046825 [Acacia pycnantha]|nr:hypothetical protein K1719_046825 [Acacia pycnantha]